MKLLINIVNNNLLNKMGIKHSRSFVDFYDSLLTKQPLNVSA